MRTPIPLRWEILALLSESSSPLSLAEIQRKLGSASKSAVLRWLQAMVKDNTVKVIDDNYALVDTAEYSVSRDIVSLSNTRAIVSATSRGFSATLYSEKFDDQLLSKRFPDEFKALSDKFIDDLINLIHPGIQSRERARKTADSGKLVGLNFTAVMSFDGTKAMATGGEELSELTKKVVKLLSKYGPMSLDEIAEQLNISVVEAYQVTSPLVPTLAEREGDGRIRLMIKVAQ